MMLMLVINGILASYRKVVAIVFPHTHKIISEHLHRHILDTFGVELNKKSLIYGSIKPDIAPSLAKLDHFKPQTFNLIMNEVHKLSTYSFTNNSEAIRDLSTQIGVVTHFIADFFCVPHNDRVKYRKATIINHLIYEGNLHKLFKDYNDNNNNNNREIVPSTNQLTSEFNVGNYSAHLIKGVIDGLHHKYILREESLMNDLTSSLHATSVVGSYIMHHVLKGDILKAEDVA